MLVVDIIAATVISAFCGLGVGGGGLFVIYLTLVRGFSQLSAQGVNLAFFVISSLCAAFLHFYKGRAKLKYVAPLAFTGAFGSMLGSVLAHSVSSGTVQICFGALLVVSGIAAFISDFRKKSNNNQSDS